MAESFNQYPPRLMGGPILLPWRPRTAHGSSPRVATPRPETAEENGDSAIASSPLLWASDSQGRSQLGFKLTEVLPPAPAAAISEGSSPLRTNRLERFTIAWMTNLAQRNGTRTTPPTPPTPPSQGGEKASCLRLSPPLQREVRGVKAAAQAMHVKTALAIGRLSSMPMPDNVDSCRGSPSRPAMMAGSSSRSGTQD